MEHSLPLLLTNQSIAVYEVPSEYPDAYTSLLYEVHELNGFTGVVEEEQQKSCPPLAALLVVKMQFCIYPLREESLLRGT